MSTSLFFWKKLYAKLKDTAVCIDIERTRFSGPIAMIGWYEPRDGIVDCNHFVKGQNLTHENLRRAFQRHKLLITFNGLHYDIPAIEKEFPGVFFQGRQILDLYILSRKLQLSASLKTLETTFGIERLDGNVKKGSAIRLWQRYEQHHDKEALNLLLAYNKQDTVNLYPLAERLMALIDKPAPIPLENWS